MAANKKAKTSPDAATKEGEIDESTNPESGTSISYSLRQASFRNPLQSFQERQDAADMAASLPQMLSRKYPSTGALSDLSTFATATRNPLETFAEIVTKNSRPVSIGEDERSSEASETLGDHQLDSFPTSSSSSSNHWKSTINEEDMEELDEQGGLIVGGKSSGGGGRLSVAMGNNIHATSSACRYKQCFKKSIWRNISR